MAEEKVIHEVRFIETDDGFRIEVKGDKEAMRQMGGPCMGMGPGMGHGFGRGRRFGRRMRHRRFRRMGGRMGGYGPGWWDDEVVDEGEPDV
jgi:hypothetical protein